MECPVVTTTARNVSYAQIAEGKYDHIRLYQVSYRWPAQSLAANPTNATTWILPRVGSGPSCAAGCEESAGGYPMRTWQLPRGPPAGCQDCGGSLERFSAVCWYFGKSLSDGMTAAAAATDDAADPVPIGLISSTIGGTSIQEWMPPSATGNATCADNNCGWAEQLDPRNPVQPATKEGCANASLANVWSCPTGLCSSLYQSNIAPLVNVTIAGAVWYQGEQNVLYGRGDAGSGYECQQAALIRSWREAWSAVPNTTAADFPFGVVTLAGGASEGAYYWSANQHVPYDQWLACVTQRSRAPACLDVPADWTAGLRVAQTGGYGYTPNAALPNVFLGQNFDQGEPCGCDRNTQPPGGCWANEQCYGDGPYSLNRTWNFQNSGIHPRVKDIVGGRLARALLHLLASPNGSSSSAPTPKLAGCRLTDIADAGVSGGGGAARAVLLLFDAALLGGESVVVQAPVPGALLPFEFQVGPANVTSGNSGWVRAVALAAVNATAVAATLPPGSPTPTAIRYAWGDYVCCPGMNATTFFCPPAACPLVTSATAEPAVPFWAAVDAATGRCTCPEPWSCDA
jgi:hypothetical protein